MTTTETILAYCPRCRSRQPVTDATYSRTERGRATIKGSCLCCGTRVWRFYAWDRDDAALSPTRARESNGRE